MGSYLAPDEQILVRNTAIFSRLQEETVVTLLSAASRRNFHRGETIFLQEDPATHCFIVLNGWIKLYRLTTAGNEAVVAVFTRGQSFGEPMALTEPAYQMSGEAATDATLLVIPCSVLIEMIRKNPEIGLAMLASTSYHLNMMVRQIEQLKAHTGAQRVARFLLSLCGDAGTRCCIGLPYDKTLIAGWLGIKPESLSRAFARLRGHGVDVNQSTAIIHDLEQLKRFVQETGEYDFSKV